MALATFSLPVDIPWQRIAFSPDMMDKQACDRDLPLRWRSSIAVFGYEPPADQQRMDGFLASYLKVACTITGYQPDGKEIRIRERLGRSGWAAHAQDETLNDAVESYHACYGAMLEVVVAPPQLEAIGTRLEDYPYFADFDPKKRELYEQVTDTGEVMSRSLDDVGVRHGQTTSQSHEVRDAVSLGANVSAGPKGGPGVSAGLEHSTTDLNQRTTENVRTTDAERENRETFSHTTQLSQMYHQLNSYHLGTNRAAFFVLPRPHVVQSTDPDGTPRTFVDGPRQLEGIQEFMFVVVRPKSLKEFCVEAYLETAHRVQTPVAAAPETQSTPLSFPKLDRDEPGADTSIKAYSDFITIEVRAHRTLRFDPPAKGFVIDTTDPRSTPGHEGIHIIQETPIGDAKPLIDIQPDYVEVNCEVLNSITPLLEGGPHNVSSTYALEATIFWKKDAVSSQGYNDTLLLTGRAVCSCGEIRITGPFEKEVSVVYEKVLAPVGTPPGRKGEAMPIHDANRLGANIHRAMLQSLSSADRYPRGAVGLLDTQLVAGALARVLRGAATAPTARATEWAGIPEGTRKQLTTYAPSITRLQLLQMPLARQVEQFSFSFAEAVELRRILADLAAPVGPPPVPEHRLVRVPELAGLQLEEAREALLSANLSLDDAVTVDSPLPRGVVVGQDPPAEKEVAAETQVAVQLASGYSVRLPEVLALRLSEALCQLRHAGLQSEPLIEGSFRQGTVVRRMEPLPRAWVMPHAPVTLWME